MKILKPKPKILLYHHTGVAPSIWAPSKLSQLSALPRRERGADFRDVEGLKKERNRLRDGETGEALNEFEEQGDPKSNRLSSM